MFGAAATVGAAVVVGKVVATLKETAVAWRFGTGDELDAFSVALLVPLALINVTGGSLQTAFLPAYFSVHEQEGGEAADALLSGLSVWGGVALTLAAALIALAAPLYLPYIAPGFGPQKLGLTFRLLCLTAPLLLVSGLTSLWGAALNARGRFAADDARRVGAIFFFLVLQLPFSVAGALAARVLVSLKMNWPLAAVSAAGLAVNAALSWLLVGRKGAPGLGLATGAMYLTSFVALTLLARRRLRRGAG